MKKIIYVLIFLMAYSWQAKCQNIVEPTILSKKEWKEFFENNFQLSGFKSVDINFTTPGDWMPGSWPYDAGDCNECKYKLYKIDGSRSFMIMPNTAPLGDYILYFSSNCKAGNCWCEANVQPDSMVLKKPLPNLFLFQLSIPDGISTKLGKRYIFVDGKTGKLFNKLIETDSSTLRLNKIDTATKKIIYDVIITKSKKVITDAIEVNYKTFVITTAEESRAFKLNDVDFKFIDSIEGNKEK